MNQNTQAFTPYANEAEVLHVGELMIENRLDRVTLSGALDLTADRAGLARARELHALLGRIVAVLDGQTLPDRLQAPTPGSVANPFV